MYGLGFEGLGFFIPYPQEFCHDAFIIPTKAAMHS